MRLSTLIISSAFVLASMSAALSTERENMLVARFANSDFLAEVEARAYYEEPELYTRGGGLSRPSRERSWYTSDSRPTPPQIRRTSLRDALLRSRPPQTTSRDTAAYRANRKTRWGLGGNNRDYRHID